jgi:hypothetical protein
MGDSKLDKGMDRNREMDKGVDKRKDMVGREDDTG